VGLYADMSRMLGYRDMYLCFAVRSWTEVAKFCYSRLLYVMSIATINDV
jgi:hypothetical protein